MQQGWVSVHRKLLDNPIFKNHKLLSVFMYCLLKASHTEHEQLVGDCIVRLKAGELATGRKAISSATGLTEQNTKTALNKLKALSILTIKPTNKYSIISIVNWDSYQQTNQQVTSKQPASNQQVTTNNNGNKGNNENNTIVLDGFEHWWSFYPSERRTDKKGCLSKFKTYCKKLSDSDVESLVNEITIDLKARLSNTEDLKYYPLSKTYINQKKWMDGKE